MKRENFVRFASGLFGIGLLVVGVKIVLLRSTCSSEGFLCPFPEQWVVDFIVPAMFCPHHGKGGPWVCVNWNDDPVQYLLRVLLVSAVSVLCLTFALTGREIFQKFFGKVYIRGDNKKRKRTGSD